MLRIGEFSRICRVPVSALRYYDEVGLLKPSRVDTATGYRYYALAQLPRLNRLLALRDMGLSLEQIARLLDESLTPEQIHGMLRLKQSELRQQLQEVQGRLEQVEAWLEQYEQEKQMPEYNVIVKRVDPVRVAEIRGTAPGIEQIGPVLNQLFDEVRDYITRHGGKVIEPATTVYYDMEQQVSVGACFPCEGAIPDSDRVKIVELPGVEQMASLIHRGSFANLGQAYNVLFQWLEANGYGINGPTRELNLEYERDGDPSKYVTEIQAPVTKG